MNSRGPLKPSEKWTYIVLGALLIVAALGAIGYTGWQGWLQWHAKKPGAPLPAGFYTLTSYFAGAVVGIFGGIWLIIFATKQREEATGALQVRLAGGAVAPAKRARQSIRRWSSCNVLQVGAGSRQLWGFGVGKHGFAQGREQSVAETDPLPARQVAKDWKTLFQPRLNIALLPVDKVFLRVLHLPAGSFEETLSMVELQLEKISPLPVTQIVWSIQTLPQQLDDLQTVIAIVVSRDLVDKVLGELETQGYLADRLEVPLLDQLQATPITGDGAWIYPGNDSGKFTALLAWWYGGVLRSLGLIHVPAVQNRGALLEEQLKQMSWAGELEGWLTTEPRWHLVADEATARLWQPMFYSWLGHNVEVESPVPPTQLAGLTANRAARASVRANILPAEYSTRYRQQFLDRLWIRALGTLAVAYGIWVAIYLLLLTVQNYQTSNVEAEARSMARSYTNSLQLKAQMQILQDRQALKFAFLDCWKTTAELLPEGLTLVSFDFKGGKTLILNGTAPAESKLVPDFNNQMRKALCTTPGLEGQLLFSSVTIANRRLDPSHTTEKWDFECELAHGEKE